MRGCNFASPTANRASVCITSTLYDRRALDSTCSLPLYNSLSNLAFLTATSSRIREILAQDGGLERLIEILSRGLELQHESSRPSRSTTRSGPRPDRSFSRTSSVHQSSSPPVKPFSMYATAGCKTQESTGATSTQGSDPYENSLMLRLPSSLVVSRTASYSFECWSLAFQCVINLCVRGSEALRLKVLGSGILSIVAVVLEEYVNGLVDRSSTRSRNLDARSKGGSWRNGASSENSDPIRPKRAQGWPSLHGNPSQQGHWNDSSLFPTGADQLARVPTPETLPSDSDGSGRDESTSGDTSESPDHEDLGIVRMDTSTPDLASAASDSTSTASFLPPPHGSRAINRQFQSGGSGEAANDLPQKSKHAGKSRLRRESGSSRMSGMDSRENPSVKGNLDEHEYLNPTAKSPEDAFQKQIKEEDIILALQLLAFLSKFAPIRDIMLDVSRVNLFLRCSDPNEETRQSTTHHHHHHHQLNLGDNTEVNGPLATNSHRRRKLPSGTTPPTTTTTSNIESPRHNLFAVVQLLIHQLSTPERESSLSPTTQQIQLWAISVMRNIFRKDETRNGVRMCSNVWCGAWETSPRQFAKCRRCRKAKFCSVTCMKTSWHQGHRWICRRKESAHTPDVA